MNRNESAVYIRANFEPHDRLAIVLLNKRANAVIQRLATAERIAAADVQGWLTQQNGRGYEVYISMNVLRENARGRTKADVAAIRHVYLDFDEGGTKAVEGLTKRDDLPRPNYLISTSPDKWQVIWKVRDFAKDEAEVLQKALAHDSGADPAATDCARVLRLPGFYNHKYNRPHMVRAEPRATEIYGPEHFPKIGPTDRSTGREIKARFPARASKSGRTVSQSERDWAYAKRALSRGESQTLVAAAIASHRRYDKADPKYYAELTVRRAAQALDLEVAPERI